MLRTVPLGAILIIREILTDHTCLYHVINAAEVCVCVCVCGASLSRIKGRSLAPGKETCYRLPLTLKPLSGIRAIVLYTTVTGRCRNRHRANR
jgi:hypothetical protein